MKWTIAAVICLAFAATIALTLSPARGEDPAGLTLFKKNGCNECHTIGSLGVEKDAKKSTTEAAESENGKKKKVAPDLSGVGLKHEAKWISAYLNKEETKDGEKHEKRFKGSEADRRTVAMWLASLKTEAKAKPSESEPAEVEKKE